MKQIGRQAGRQGIQVGRHGYAQLPMAVVEVAFSLYAYEIVCLHHFRNFYILLAVYHVMILGE